ncbi:Crp/Fnr family transcriptional regulator [Flavobacterium filum]|uniref:Crp/Fnr family transcriptional regulator n=1 Tax=Flavobacterium filum TaxID=370974 RepID=UPI0023F48A66|nr:Crp/Fnr family transcriptional regulator [Flavobacterium filum]
MTEQDRIKCFLKSFNILTDSEMEDFINLTQKKSLNKFDYFIKEGEICSQVAFILSGIFRSYYVSDKDEEVTYCILFPDNFATAYSSFLTSQATQENIQAITQAELLIITKENVEKLVSKSHNWTCFLKKIAEQEYIELEKRIFQLQRSDATKRYSDLMKNQPEYIQKIPLQYLSSYLGITQRHLSRIRKEFSF